jgi:SAP domain.
MDRATTTERVRLVKQAQERKSFRARRLLKKVTITELRQRLQELGLPTTGRKAELENWLMGYEDDETRDDESDDTAIDGDEENEDSGPDDRTVIQEPIHRMRVTKRMTRTGALLSNERDRDVETRAISSNEEK